MGPYTFHQDPNSGEASLYDLRGDPLEQRDISSEDPERLSALKEMLDRFIESASAPPVVGVLSEAEEEELRELGYVE